MNNHRLEGRASGRLGRWMWGLLGGALLAVPMARAQWTSFRGPWGQGHAQPPGAPAAGLPLHWSESEFVRWKTPIAHRGWSTPVVLDGQVWLTTATLEGHEFFVVCVDAETGKIRLFDRVFHCDYPEPLDNGASMNCYATPSPVIEQGRVYVHFGKFGTACLDTADGRVIWRRHDLPCRHYRGPSSSPVLFGNLLILTFDGADLQYHIALDKRTGDTVWRTDRSAEWNDEHDPGRMAQEGDRRKAHSTPLIVEIGGRPQMLSVGAKAAYAYDPATGRELWKVRHQDWSAAPVPLYSAQLGLAYFLTGLNQREMLAVKVGGSGDVTDTHLAWRQRKGAAKYASPLLVDGLIYQAASESFLTCLDAATGKVVWNERVGGKFAASPVFADGRLYFFSQEGKTVVVEPGRQFKLLAVNTLDDGFMASPAVVGKAFFLRTKTHLYRIEQ